MKNIDQYTIEAALNQNYKSNIPNRAVASTNSYINEKAFVKYNYDIDEE